MASPNTPLGIVNNPLVYGVYNIYSPSQFPSMGDAILTENNVDLLTEGGAVLLIE